SIYIDAFKQAISDSLREIDSEFVRYVATKAKVQRQLNARFIETLTPLVRHAVERAVSEMVVSSLSSVNQQKVIERAAPEEEPDETADWVNPENSRIVTTYAERRILEIATEIVGEESELVGKDTESYYTILYQGKVNRW